MDRAADPPHAGEASPLSLKDFVGLELQDCSDCACLIDGQPALLSFRTVLSAPILYSLELTPTCNNRCPACSNVFVSNKTNHLVKVAHPMLDLDGWRAILESITPDVQLLKLTGGEPTLYPQFKELLAELARRDIRFTLFTNGRWVYPTTLIRLLRDIPQCAGLLISLHGVTAHVHEAFSCVPGSFAETVANIQEATAAGLTVATSTVITQQNTHQVADIVFLAQELGADHAVFNRYLGPPLPEIEPTASQLSEAIVSVDELTCAGHPVRFGNCIPQCFIPNSSVGCLAGSAYVTIDPWGNVRPCNHDALICGNLLKQSLEAIWHGEAMNRWRRLLPKACVDCTNLDRCRTGCRAMVHQWGEGLDPLYRPHADELVTRSPIFTPVSSKATVD